MLKTWKNEPFDSNLARARTLDAGWYLDPEVFDLEQERIFARTWQPVAKLSDVQKVGDYVATEAAREPIVVTRDHSNQIRAYYNVCPHRAGALARGKGSRKSLQCLYHGWTFSLEGELLNAPALGNIENFDPGCFGLREVRVDLWGPYIFVNLDEDAPSLNDFWGEAFQQSAGVNYSEWMLVESREYLIDCNWKVYLDNYVEGYHVPMAHPGLNREMNLDDYHVDTFRYHSTQRVVVKPSDQGNAKKRRYTETSPDDQICYHTLFPNFMIDTYPDNLSTNIVKPLAVDKTLLTFEWFFKDPSDRDTIDSMIAFADEVQWEDIEICEYVQKGLRSRSYDVGRFSERHENGVHHFQSLVYEFMNKP